MATVRELLIEWGFEVDEQQLNRLNDAIDDTKKKANDSGRSLREFGRNASAAGRDLTVGLTLPIAAAGAAAVSAASDAEEIEAKFGTVFESVTGQAEAFAAELSGLPGVSDRAAKELLGNTGDILVGFGFTEEAALNVSRQVNLLATDLASFSNVEGGAEAASRALTSALLGEREAAKTLGVVITEEQVKAKIQKLTKEGVTFATEQQAKAVATLAIATEQSSKAIGDAERTSDSFANQTREAMASLDDLAVVMGQELIPLLLPLVTQVTEWAREFSNLDEGTKSIIVDVALLAAAIGPVVFIFGKLITLVGFVISGFGLLAKAATFLNAVMLANPITAILVLLGVLVAVWIANWDEIREVSLFVWEEIKQALRDFSGVFFQFVDNVKAGFAAVWDFVALGADTAVQAVMRAWGGIAAWFDRTVVNPILKAWDKASGIVSSVADFLGLGGQRSPQAGNSPGRPGSPESRLAPNIEPRPLGGAQGGNRTVEVSAPISITLPQGTPATQVEALESTVRRAARDVFQQQARELLSEMAD